LRAVLAPIQLCGEGMDDGNKKACSFLLLSLKVSLVNSVIDAKKESIKIPSSVASKQVSGGKVKKKKKETGTSGIRTRISQSRQTSVTRRIPFWEDNKGVPSSDYVFYR
jgi:hypothetical protein